MPTDSPKVSTESDSKLEPRDQIRKGLAIEGKDLEAASYELNEDLLDLLGNKEVGFVLTEDPVTTYNKGLYDSTLTYDDPEFPAVEVHNAQGERFYGKEAVSMYQKFLLKEPGTGRILRIDYTLFNRAYFPFNSLEAELKDDKRESEIARRVDFPGTYFESNFDRSVLKEAKQSVLSLSFGGYIFKFTKFDHKNEQSHIELEIDKFDKQEGGGIKCIRKSNKLEGMDVKQFNELLIMTGRAIKNSRRVQ